MGWPAGGYRPSDEDAACTVDGGVPAGEHPHRAVLLLDDRGPGDAGAPAEGAARMDGRIEMASSDVYAPRSEGLGRLLLRDRRQVEGRDAPGDPHPLGAHLDAALGVAEAVDPLVLAVEELRDRLEIGLLPQRRRDRDLKVERLPRVAHVEGGVEHDLPENVPLAPDPRRGVGPRACGRSRRAPPRPARRPRTGGGASAHSRASRRRGSRPGRRTSPARAARRRCRAPPPRRGGSRGWGPRRRRP